ncbi:DNA-binding transcriptional regulator, GntR family [Anaerovirgula multivorans]|uniref:DNA-binding transcriptional regulator, GntR family n=1 Tax=Anaerovirgula multivorans TaxID=312168 RepID=A0A239CBQ6_9FIRM|nr:GntR family transcriptional regulator [Anaerovirgula multivorans]SNS17540.1 DNA-binding transcriptional regulator, GntR family [Anaerovirgula multivorans]
MSENSCKTTLVDIIYANIRKDITQGILLPGQKINTKELSERYGASLTPIKLALNRLVSDKIIENFPRQGMKVKSVQADEIDEIFDMRLMLDLYYTKEIITTVNYNESLREEFRKNVEEHLKIVSDLTPDSPVDAYIQNYSYDYKFHELFLKCSGNRKVVDMFHYINPFLYSNYTFGKQSKERDISGVKEHQVILDAILSQDEDALKEAIRVHIYNAKTAIALILKVYKIL